jgi:hypothetical protein
VLIFLSDLFRVSTLAPASSKNNVFSTSTSEKSENFEQSTKLKMLRCNGESPDLMHSVSSKSFPRAEQMKRVKNHGQKTCDELNHSPVTNIDISAMRNNILQDVKDE